MKTKYYFPVLVLVTAILMFLSKYILDMEMLIFNSLSDRMAQEQVTNIINFNKKWEWVRYLLLPLILLIKITLISSVLWMGTFFFDKKIIYNKLFNIVTQAEFIFMLVAIVKVIWFAFQQDYTLRDVQSFYPLSALSIIGYEGLQPWFVYPFQTLNLFELAYWILLAWLLAKELQSTTDKALKIVASSYGSALLFWVVAVMFFTLNVS